MALRKPKTLKKKHTLFRLTDYRDSKPTLAQLITKLQSLENDKYQEIYFEYGSIYAIEILNQEQIDLIEKEKQRLKEEREKIAQERRLKNAERLKKRVLDRQLKEYALLKVRLAQLETKLNNDNGN